MKISIDTVPFGQETAAATAQGIAASYPKVTYRVVTESGPGGGNPIIQYRGPRDQVEAMITKHYGADALVDHVREADIDDMAARYAA